MQKPWLLLVLVFLAACETKPVPPSIRPVKAIKASTLLHSENRVIFPGTVRASKRGDLSFRVDGIIVKKEIVVGHAAKRGELLLQIDPREYEIAKLRAKGKVESIQAQLDFAERDFIRMQNIQKRDPGAISESLLDRKRENINQYKGDLTTAEADFQQASDNLSYTSLSAPFDGIVVAIYVENHEQVRAKQPVLRFLNSADSEMEISVPEKYINGLIAQRENLNFEVQLDAFPGRSFNATIKEIGTEASSSTLTYPVILSVQGVPEELSLLPGMSGEAILQQPKRAAEKVFLIPRSAIFTDNLKGTFVWVVNPTSQTVHKKAVTLSTDSGPCVHVLEGIEESDWVVTAGTSFLSDGQSVKMDAEQTKPCGS